MNAFRSRVLDQTFKKLDKNGDGNIALEHLRNIYTVKHHPKFQSGELTEEQILEDFISNFENVSGATPGKKGQFASRKIKVFPL